LCVLDSSMDNSHSRTSSNSSSFRGEGGFPEDTPSYWMETYLRKQKVQAFGENLKSLLDSIGDSTDQSDYDNLQAYIKDGCETPEDSGFEDFANILCQLNNKKAKLAKSFCDWQANTDTFMAEVHSIDTKVQDFEKGKAVFFSKMQKFLSMKTTTKDVRLDQYSKKMDSRRQDLEMSRFDIDCSLSTVQASQEVAILRPLAQVLQSYWTFLKDGFELLQPFQRKIEELNAYVTEQTEMVEKKKQLLRDKRRNHSMQLQNRGRRGTIVTAPPPPRKSPSKKKTGIRDLDAANNTEPKTAATECEGQLFIPSPNFQPVWASVKDGVIRISRPGAADIAMPCMLVTAKQDTNSKYRNTFTCISPSQTVQLQTETLDEFELWLCVIQNAIAEQLNRQKQSSTFKTPEQIQAAKKDQQVLEQQIITLRTVPGNDKCADCQSEEPQWLSLNLGIMVCLNCSGVHRSLGTHISKVRSATLDKLDASMLAYLCAVGNENANTVWEASLRGTSASKKPNAQAAREIREMYIKAKYEYKSFLKRTGSSEQLCLQLFDAVRKGETQEALKMVTWGADVNWPNPAEEMCTALHFAVSFENAVLCEMFLANGALQTKQELRGWTPLHYACYQDSPSLVRLLLARGGRSVMDTKDIDGKTPLSIGTAFHGAELKCAPEFETEEGKRAQLDTSSSPAERTGTSATSVLSSSSSIVPVHSEGVQGLELDG